MRGGRVGFSGTPWALEFFKTCAKDFAKPPSSLMDEIWVWLTLTVSSWFREHHPVHLYTLQIDKPYYQFPPSFRLKPITVLENIAIVRLLTMTSSLNSETLTPSERLGRWNEATSFVVHASLGAFALETDSPFWHPLCGELNSLMCNGKGLAPQIEKTRVIEEP